MYRVLMFAAAALLIGNLRKGKCRSRQLTGT